MSAGLSINPNLKTLTDSVFDPADKYIGQIQVLEKEVKKRDCRIDELDEKIKVREKEINALTAFYEKKIDGLRAENDFNTSELISQSFKDTLSSQLNKTLPILDKTLTSTSNISLRKQSPRKSRNQAQLRNEHDESIMIQIPEFDIESTASQFDENIMIPDTQPTTTPTDYHNQTDDLSVMPATQFDENGHFKQERNLFDDSDDEDEIPATQFSLYDDNGYIPDTQPIVVQKPKSNKKSLAAELKRIKIEQEVIKDDEAVFHKFNFKFIEFEVYDNLFDKQINYIKENINPYFDQIIEKIINLQIYNELNNFEFKFSKLNEDFVLVLLDLDPKTNIPELIFILLANLNSYTNYLEDKELLSKLTNKCCIIDERNFDKYGGMLMRVIDLFILIHVSFAFFFLYLNFRW